MSNRTFVNNEITSKDRTLKLLGKFCPFIGVMKSLVLLTVYSHILRCDKNTEMCQSLAKYFPSRYDAVLMLEIIGRIGRSSTVLSFFNLRISLVLSLFGIIFCILALRI